MSLLSSEKLINQIDFSENNHAANLVLESQHPESVNFIHCPDEQHVMIGFLNQVSIFRGDELLHSIVIQDLHENLNCIDTSQVFEEDDENDEPHFIATGGQ